MCSSPSRISVTCPCGSRQQCVTTGMPYSPSTTLSALVKASSTLPWSFFDGLSFYKPLEHQVVDTDPALSKDKPSKKDQGNVDEAFTKADKVVEGEYGIPVVTHCCLEPHGQVTEMREGELHIWPSTQNVSRYSDQLGAAAGVDQNKIRVECQYMGGGFGSKFNSDKWGTIGALLSKQTGEPVKLLLERDIELMTAGNRPSAYAKIKVGAQKDGTI